MTLDGSLSKSMATQWLNKGDPSSKSTVHLNKVLYNFWNEYFIGWDQGFFKRKWLTTKQAFTWDIKHFEAFKNLNSKREFF